MRKTLIVIFFVLLPHPARALCLGLGLQGIPSTVTFQGAVGEYNVYDPADYVQTISFNVGGGASVANCSYFVTISPGGSGNASQRRMTRGGTTLDYNIYTNVAGTNILRDLASAGGVSDIIAGEFPVVLGANQLNGHNMYWTIPHGQVMTAGATPFQDASLTVNLYTGLLLGIYVLADTKTVTFQARAESSVDVSLVDMNSSFAAGDTTQLVDFGTLASDASLSYDAMIRSNDGYLVTLKSQNKQVLAHQSAPAVVTTVPYTLTFGGAAVDLSSGAPVQAASSSGTATPAAGARFRTTLKIGTLTGAETAGNYQDIITVNVSAH